ncbi:DUF3078 domain-containing protein [Flavobacterium sp.]|uniref:DUF3078 domain-containing protein n=1 Tax=Flavobacterium sp. TaxID=239 RepID=UPI002607E2F8|nr:DUF3078 domain-containing protein [Flavobacterium sp.]MDD2984841.1 DUF3078 domain-containing protein [Flavobacterium sp.]
MKKLVILLTFLTVTPILAQQEVVKSVDEVVKAVNDTTRTNGWTKKGKISFLFNQSSFDNWVTGGENNISGNLGINYDFNYKSEDWSWDNKIIASYGLVRTKNSEFEKKTDDRLEFNSLAGKRAGGYWYYSAFVNFQTQFSKGYVYDTDANGKEIRTEYTDFFSPAYLTFGPGLMWKKTDNFKFNLAPISSKITFVTEELREQYAGVNYFGVDEGKTMRYELGFYASGYYKFNLFENVSAENILSLYSNYLEDPQNVDLDYQLNLVMTINKFLSTNLIVQTVYDDNAFRGLQIRQVFGLGVNYNF